MCDGTNETQDEATLAAALARTAFLCGELIAWNDAAEPRSPADSVATLESCYRRAAARRVAAPDRSG